MKWNQSEHQTKATTMSTNHPTYGQMIAVVEVYLLKKTGQQIKINLPRNVGEIKKLVQAYQTATGQS